MEQLRMLLIDSPVLGIPAPEGYFIRTGIAGDADADAWIHACETLNEGIWTRERFYHDMIDEPGCGWDNIFFICRESDGAVAGTATAFCREVPCLHMVGMAKEFMGQGLSASINAAAIDHMTKKGIWRIQLLTDEFRVPAIKTYLRLGFRPWYFMDDMQERWRGVFTDIGCPREGYFAYDENTYRRIPV